INHCAGVKRRSLARVMSKQGICSRQEAVHWIESGRVKVNGKVAQSPEMLVALNAKIELVGIEAPLPKTTLRYVVMNKRRGVVTTHKDEHGRATVYDDLRLFLTKQNITERLFAVGRLDKDTEGLLLFTNDNDLANFLTAPENGVPKTYLATLNKPLTDHALQQLQSGIEIKARGEHYIAQPHDIVLQSRRVIQLTLSEGKNREVRRLFEAIGYTVERLVRIGFAGLRLNLHCNPPELNTKPLASGTCIECQPEELLKGLG
ncbi:MAG: pseudouridine synthase, partial [Candidatus Thermochlorobacter sp.]